MHQALLSNLPLPSCLEPQMRFPMISNQMLAPSSSVSAHSPDLGGMAGLAVHLEHPPMVGK